MMWLISTVIYGAVQHQRFPKIGYDFSYHLHFKLLFPRVKKIVLNSKDLNHQQDLSTCQQVESACLQIRKTPTRNVIAGQLIAVAQTLNKCYNAIWQKYKQQVIYI